MGDHALTIRPLAHFCHLEQLDGNRHEQKQPEDKAGEDCETDHFGDYISKLHRNSLSGAAVVGWKVSPLS